MLQWMGGSRKKVTASRRSTQKRQRQYFEQRRKQQQFQQQQKAGLESYDEGTNIYGQHHREHRSLDVMSLLNLSTTAQGYRSCVANEGQEEQEVNAPPVKQQTAKGPSRDLTKTVSHLDSGQLNEARVPSDKQIKNVPPQRVLLNATVNISEVSNGHTLKSDAWKATMDQKLSVFDLLGDDIPDGDSEGHPELEDHVAFSVEGLGKVGAETPVHSRKRLGSYYGTFGIGMSSPWKAERKKLSKKINYLPDDFELEVDSMMRDIDVPLSGGSLEIPIDIMDYYINPEKKISSFRDYRQVDDFSRVMKCCFDDKELFHGIENGVEDMWDATSSFPEENLLCEKKTNIHWGNWPCQVYSDLADFIDYGKYEGSDYPFEGRHQLRKRETKKAKGIFNELDAHAFRCRMFEMDHSIETFNRASSIIQSNLNFGNLYSHTNWSYFTTEDVKDDLILPSEESCSSAAVRDEEMNNLPSVSTARQSRTCNNGSTEKRYAVNRFSKELHSKIRDDFQKENGSSGRCTQNPIPSDNKPVKHSMSPCQEDIGPPEKLSFREGHSSFGMGSGSSSLSPVPETKFPSLYSKHLAEDALPKLDFDAKFARHKSKCDSSANHSPSCSFISEKFSFCQPFSHMHTSSLARSKGVFEGATNADSELGGNTPSDSELGGNTPSYSSHENAGSHGATSAIELSAEAHGRKNEGDEFKRQPAKNDNEPGERRACGMNVTAVDDLNSLGNLPKLKEAKVVTLEPKQSQETSDHAEKTSSSLRFSERSPVEKEYTMFS